MANKDRSKIFRPKPKTEKRMANGTRLYASVCCTVTAMGNMPFFFLVALSKLWTLYFCIPHMRTAYVSLTSAIPLSIGYLYKYNDRAYYIWSYVEMFNRATTTKKGNSVQGQLPHLSSQYYDQNQTLHITYHTSRRCGRKTHKTTSHNPKNTTKRSAININRTPCVCCVWCSGIVIEKAIEIKLLKMKRNDEKDKKNKRKKNKNVGNTIIHTENREQQTYYRSSKLRRGQCI